MSAKRKAPDNTKRRKRLTRLSGLTQDIIAPALAKKSAYLRQMIAHWPDIAGPTSQWAQPVDMFWADQHGGEGTLLLSIHSGRGPQALAESEALISQVNSWFGFRLISVIKVKQDLPPAPQTHKNEISSAHTEAQRQTKATSLQQALDRLGKTISANESK